ncbi:MAG: MMPL family transporter [Planctomycetota bacterium]
MRQLVRLAISARWVLALAGVVSLAVAYPVSQRLATDQSIASLFSPEDPTLLEYESMRRWFGKDDVLVLMYRDDDLATRDGVERSRRLTDQIRAIEGVTATLSPAILNEAADEINKVRLIPTRNGKSDTRPTLMRPQDPVGRGLSDVFAGYTHSADYSHGAVVAMINDEQSATTVPKLREVARLWSEEPGISGVSLVGEPVLVDEAFALVRRDGQHLAVVTVGLLSLVVILALRDVRIVVLLGLTIGWSVIMTRAIMVTAGIKLSLIASILTAIVTVVAVTAILHLGVRYHRNRRAGKSQTEAIADTLTRLGAPIFWTCATDAAGFAALWFSEILPVRQFGLMVALSSLNVFMAVFIFAPFCLHVPELRIYRRHDSGGHRLGRSLRRLGSILATRCLRWRWWLVVSASVMFVATVLLVTRSETETSFLRNFRDDSSIVRDYGSVEQNLGGAGVWDLVLDVPADLSNNFLREVRLLEEDLLEQLGGEGGLSKAISIADATEVFGKSRAGRWLPAKLRIEAMRTKLPTFIGALISEPSEDQRRKLRIMLRSSETLDAQTKRGLITGARRIANEHWIRWQEAESADTPKIASGESPVIVTGYYVIMTRLVDQLVSDQWRCFAASAALIWLLMSLATRRIRLATAALIPNLLPAFVVLAVVAVIGERVNMGAAMIAAVSVGLSIDGSVHLMTLYRRRQKPERDESAAIVSAAGNIGVPVLLATIALVVGFSVLSTSEFIPTATFGTLVAWTLVVGTLINLTVLPALIRIVEQRRSARAA